MMLVRKNNTDCRQVSKMWEQRHKLNEISADLYYFITA